MNAEIAAVCERVVSAVLNGTGQGMLVVLLLAASFKLFRNLNAATRHALDLIALVLLVVLPVAHLYTETTPADRADVDFSSAAPIRIEQIPPVAIAIEALPAVAEETPPESITSPPRAIRERKVPERSSSPGWVLLLPNYVSLGFVGIWAGIALVRLGFLALQLLAVRQLKRKGRNAPDAVRELFSKLCVELRVNRAPQLRVAAEISVPIAAGFKEPAVLLPERLCEQVSQARLEEILRHELAHVVRRDDWANLLQQCMRALFFFHPGVIWACRRMTVDREVACDDHVLSACRDRKAYALALAEFASRHQRWNVIAAPAAWSKYSQLKERIDMILEPKRNSAPVLARGKASLFAAAAVLIATLAFYSAPRLVFADAPAEAPPAEPAAPAAAPRALAAPAPEAIPAPPEPPSGNVFFAPGGQGRAVIVAPGRRKHIVALAGGEDMPEDGGPHVKVFRRGPDDDTQRRLDRLEQMLEKLVQRDEMKKDMQFQFQDRFNPKLSFDGEQFARINEKAARAAERAGRDAERALADVQKHAGDLGDGNHDGALEQKGKRALDILEQQRRVLETQMRALEAQSRAIEAQMRKVQAEMNASRDGNLEPQPRKVKPAKRKRVEPQNESSDGAEQKKVEPAPAPEAK